jgi:hypothetical protein
LFGRQIPFLKTAEQQIRPSVELTPRNGTQPAEIVSLPASQLLLFTFKKQKRTAAYCVAVRLFFRFFRAGPAEKYICLFLLLILLVRIFFALFLFFFVKFNRRNANNSAENNHYQQ